MNQEVQTKKCSKCGIIKSVSEFKKEPRSIKTPYSSCCRSCDNIRAKIYRQSHKIEAKKYSEQWRKENKEYKKELDRIYKSNHREIARERSKKRYYEIKDTPEYKEYQRKKRETRKPKRNKKCQQQYKNDISYKLEIICRNRLRIALKNKHKIHHTMELIGCSIKELKEHLERQFKDGMTWNNHSLYGWHIDHIIPCSSFDLTDFEQQKKCFHYTNLQPLWAKDNLSKSDKLIVE